MKLSKCIQLQILIQKGFQPFCSGLVVPAAADLGNMVTVSVIGLAVVRAPLWSKIYDQGGYSRAVQYRRAWFLKIRMGRHFT